MTTATIPSIKLRRDLWRLRKHLPSGLESRLIESARLGHDVAEPQEEWDGFGTLVSYRAWIGPRGRLVYVRLPAECFVVTP